MTAAREQLVAATCDLLETHGYHATGLNAIIEKSGTPKGSLYYYFPDGKEGLAAAAIEHSGHLIAARIRAGLAGGRNAAQDVGAFVRRIADAVETSGYSAGAPLAAVAMETATTSERLNAACRDAYARLEAAFEEKLVADGLTAGRATQLAAFITAAVEGGIILSRTYHTGDPLRRVADELETLLKRRV